MMDEWFILIKKYTIAGARTKFESVCATLFKKKFIGSVKAVKVNVGDGGIDIFAGEIGTEPIRVFQCKFFVNGINNSQKSQIRNSFKTVVESTEYICGEWTLCIPEKLTLQEHTWWSNWKNKETRNRGLSPDFIKLIDGDDLIDDLKKFHLYDEVFDEEIILMIKEIRNAVIARPINLNEELDSASSFVRNLKNYFSKEKGSHIARKQTTQIITWISSNLLGRNPLEKLLVVKGKKGVGKSTVLKDVYSQLREESNYLLLAIKCDQFYDINAQDLAKQLFTGNVSFTDIMSNISTTGKTLVVFLDQLDALSQTSSSDRRWLQTYIKLIYDLLNYQNVRIVLSSRNFDLDYDADIRKFNMDQGVKHIEVINLEKDEVVRTLNMFGVSPKSDVLIDLLRVPYNLELFTKIPDISQINQKDSRVTLTKLYSALSTQVFSNNSLKILDCLNSIVKRMYENQPNLIDSTYIVEFINEIDYLVSHDILLRNGKMLSFFHQSFYEYYLALWFVRSEENLIEYIFQEDQNLYIRSLIKTVIEYLREVDHKRYITLYKDIFSNPEIRFHIKYLFTVEIGLVELPSDKEKLLVADWLNSSHGKLFLDVVYSKGWILFLVSNRLFSQESDLLGIFYRNINYCPIEIIKFLEADTEQVNLISRLLPGILIWDKELIPYFDNYYHYSKMTEHWYFEIMKRIAVTDINFVFVKLREVIHQEKTTDEHFKFNYRHDRIIEKLCDIDNQATIRFLLSVYLEILKETQKAYYSPYLKIDSTLLSSSQYNNRLSFRDSEDEISFEGFLFKYYEVADWEEIKSLFEDLKNSDFIQIINLMVKILTSRVSEFKDGIFELLTIINSKLGFVGTDDFLQLNIRKMISKSILTFDKNQYKETTKIILGIKHPYEIFKYEDKGTKKYSLNIGRKKYLFLKAFPVQVLENDKEIMNLYQVLFRRFGEIDHNLALDRDGSRWGGVAAPLSNANYDRFSYSSWFNSMRIINPNYKSDDFFKGGILEHSRIFEENVKKNPEKFYSFIDSLFNEPEISYYYISRGISGLIDAKWDVKEVAKLIEKEIQLELDDNHILYAVWHTKYLFEAKEVDELFINFWVRVSKSKQYGNDVLNPDMPVSDFINTSRGASLENLISLGDSKYTDKIFDTIEFVIDVRNSPSNTILCGVMYHLAQLNRLDIERSFKIFTKLIEMKNPLVLKFSIDAAQYFNNGFHNELSFYFDEIILHEELHEQSFFFVSSYIFDHINDYPLYERFVKLGDKAIKCAITVAEKFLKTMNGSINIKALQVLEHCLGNTSGDLSHEFSGVVLRKFKIVDFLSTQVYLKKYIASKQFNSDPRYLLEYLTECSSIYPVECLKLLDEINWPINVDITEKGYLGDEPLILVLSIYSRLRIEPFKYRVEQRKTLDLFDNLLAIPSIRMKAFEAMDTVLN